MSLTETAIPTQATEPETVPCTLKGHAIIAGFGLPGRAVAEVLDEHHIAYCVIELNATTVTRCSRTGTSIINGDARDPATLTRAGIENASILSLAIPNDAVVLEAVQQARRYVDLLEVLGREHDREVLAVGRRAEPRVDGHVEHLARDHAQELALCVRVLRVESAQRAALRVRVVVLMERTVDAGGSVFVGVVGLEKEPTAIAMDVRVDQHDTR